MGKMQPKISDFFNLTSTDATSFPAIDNDRNTIDAKDVEPEFFDPKRPKISVTYSRRASKFDEVKSTGKNESITSEKTSNKEAFSVGGPYFRPYPSKTLNKKRSYAQFHLELGQSDFLLRSCSTCGLKYTPGDENDEAFHTTFHKNYTLGIPFKGWRNERVIQTPSESGRIMLVLDNDSHAQRNKVQEVIKMMEVELGDEWIYHKLCKVYFFILSRRVAGCLVAESIKAAYRVLSFSEDGRSNCSRKRQAGLSSIPLHFGNICFQREVTRTSSTTTDAGMVDNNLNCAVVCDKKAVEAVCGIRAIWVSPSNRRKHIASQLLDAVRKSFCPDLVLGKSQLAFSQPTSIGQALASNYVGSGSFLVYKSSNLD